MTEFDNKFYRKQNKYVVMINSNKFNIKRNYKINKGHQINRGSFITNQDSKLI